MHIPNVALVFVVISTRSLQRFREPARRSGPPARPATDRSVEARAGASSEIVPQEQRLQEGLWRCKTSGQSNNRRQTSWRKERDRCACKARRNRHDVVHVFGNRVQLLIQGKTGRQANSRIYAEKESTRKSRLGCDTRL